MQSIGKGLTLVSKAAGVMLVFIGLAGCVRPAGEQPKARLPPTHPDAVSIGNQQWSVRNLAVKHYRNGDSIPYADTAEKLERYGRSGVGAWMHVGGNSENEHEFGLLYNWFAATDLRGLAPQGWHVPTDTEWEQLDKSLGKQRAGHKMKVPTGWKNGGGGTNESGFSAVPAGFRHWGGEYSSDSIYGSWWTATELGEDTYYAWFRGVGYDYSHMHKDRSSKQLGMSIRLIRDAR